VASFMSLVVVVVVVVVCWLVCIYLLNTWASYEKIKVPPPLVFLRIFLFRNTPAGNHQLVAEDLMEDGTISRISNAYSLWQGRRLPPTSEVKELQFVTVMVM
jgi:hypothetical protein